MLGSVAGLWRLGNLAASWWTLFLIVPALAGMVSSGIRFWNVFLLFLGCWLLAVNQGWLGHNGWAYFIGGLLVLFGLWVLLGGHHHVHVSHAAPPVTGTDTDDYPDYSAIFSTIAFTNRSKRFRGGKATSVFGALTLDLRDIDLAADAVLESNAVFGKLEILAPPHLPVRVSVTPVCGDLDNHVPLQTSAQGEHFLEIRGTSVFGRISIR